MVSCTPSPMLSRLAALLPGNPLWASWDSRSLAPDWPRLSAGLKAFGMLAVLSEIKTNKKSENVTIGTFTHLKNPTQALAAVMSCLDAKYQHQVYLKA